MEWEDGGKQTNLRVPQPHKLILLHRIRIELSDSLIPGMHQEGTENTVTDEVGDGPAGEGAEPA